MDEVTSRREGAWRPLVWMTAGLMAVAAGFGAGCGDGTICPSETMVLIASPSAGAVLSYDGSSAAPGTVTDVVVRSNLKPGDMVTLTRTAAGDTQTYEAAVDRDGTAVFAAVALPPGPVTLRADGVSGDCGAGSDEIRVDVISSESVCALALREPPLPNEHYGLPVLDMAADADASLPDFQGHVDVTAAPGASVALLVLDVEQASELAAGTAVAGDSGVASLAVTLGQGRQALRATCATADGRIRTTSPTTLVYVDTEAPACSLVSPSERTSILPDMDMDGDPSNGTQIVFTGLVDAGTSNDVAGQTGTVTVAAASFQGTPIDAQGSSTAVVTLDTPGTYDVTFSARDHAGNACSATRTYSYVTEGCSMQLQAPLDIVNSDANGDPSDGLQSDLLVQVDPACAGDTVVADCGIGATMATVPAGGLATVRATLCQDAVCAARLACSVRVIRETGVETWLGVDLEVDTEPPGPVEALVITTPDRQSMALAWTAPADVDGKSVAGYIIKMADKPLDDGNFDVTGAELGGPAPAAPGSAEGLRVDHLRTGQAYYVAIAAVDPAGNRSIVAAEGPIIPDFARTGSIGPVRPEDGNNGLGYQLAAGDFDGDGFSDVAMAAPFKSVGGQLGVGTVYVYFGSPAGLSAQPDVTIEGVEPFGQFGNGLTAIQWGGDQADDLAVGAPLADDINGRVYIFHGGRDFHTLTSAADADVVVGVAGGWLAQSAFGWSLTRARFDGDDLDDLVIGAINGGNGTSGAVVLYGGAGGSSILLSDQDSSQSGDARALILEDPNGAPCDIFAGDDQCTLFGQSVFHLGRAGGSEDATDEVGVAYFEKNAAVVFRGRQQPAAPGTVLGAFDDTIDLQLWHDSPDTRARFGASMASIADLDGDGAREIVLSAWREGADLGRVFILRGNAVGTHEVNDIALATLLHGAEVHGIGSAIVNNAMGLASPDVDGDGLEDLLVVGGIGEGKVSMFVWYGGAIPRGTFVPDSAHHVVPAPAGFTASALSTSDSTPIAAIWAGDINGDGLEDIVWADSAANTRDGLWELLSDGL